MKLRWKIYSAIYAVLVVSGAIYNLLPDSWISLYYRILLSFNKGFLGWYILHLAVIFLEIFGLVPLFLFSWRKHWLAPSFWKVFLFLRILGYYYAHYFEADLTRTAFAFNQFWNVVLGLFGFLIILPSFVALYLYAFGKKVKAQIPKTK